MSIETFLKLGQQCGLQGAELLKFVESREQTLKEEVRQQHDAEREERIREREERGKGKNAKSKGNMKWIWLN